MTPLSACDASYNPALKCIISASPEIIMSGLPGTNGLTESPDILQDYPLKQRWWVADAHADGSHELGAVHRFLSRRQACRQRVERQTGEDLGHRDRSPGEQFGGGALNVARWRSYCSDVPRRFWSERGHSYRTAGDYVPPFVPGRPDRILSGLAEILPGLFKSGL